MSIISPFPSFFRTVEIGNALSLDGSSYVSIPDDDTLDLNTKGSWEAWVKIDLNAAGSNVCILSKWNGSNTGPYAFAVGDTSGAFLVRLLTWNSVEGYAIHIGSTPITKNVWHYVAATFDGDAGEIQLYLDGQSDGSKTSGVIGYIQSSSDVVHIGDYQAVGGTMFYGLLDEVKIYNRVLSPVEITAHWNSGAGQKGTAGTGLVAGWHMDESALPIIDYSGSGNDSTSSSGTPTFVPGKIPV